MLIENCLVQEKNVIKYKICAIMDKHVSEEGKDWVEFSFSEANFHDISYDFPPLLLIN